MDCCRAGPAHVMIAAFPVSVSPDARVVSCLHLPWLGALDNRPVDCFRLPPLQGTLSQHTCIDTTRTMALQQAEPGSWSSVCITCPWILTGFISGSRGNVSWTIVGKSLGYRVSNNPFIRCRLLSLSNSLKPT